MVHPFEGYFLLEELLQRQKCGTSNIKVKIEFSDPYIEYGMKGAQTEKLIFRLCNIHPSPKVSLITFIDYARLQMFVSYSALPDEC